MIGRLKDNRIYTISDTYMKIADEALDAMRGRLKANRQLKPDGTPGYIVTLDPEQRSFKYALIAHVFACMHFEAECYIHALLKYGEEKAVKIDKKKYEERLKCLGVHDPKILCGAKKLRAIRKDIVHEKAQPLDEIRLGDWRYAQVDAEFSVEFVQKAVSALKSAEGEK